MRLILTIGSTTEWGLGYAVVMFGIRAARLCIRKTISHPAGAGWLMGKHLYFKMELR